MKKVKFRIPSKEKLAEIVFDLRFSLKPGNLSERNNDPCIKMNFSDELINKLLNSKSLTFDLKEDIVKEIKISEEEKMQTRKFMKEIKRYWDNNVNSLFFEEMAEKFGRKNIIGEYICYPTNKVVGMYFNKNEITTYISHEKSVSKLSNMEFSSIVIAEEILHLIYWELWKSIYGVNFNDVDEVFAIGGGKWCCWHIAEVIPDYVLVENKTFNKFNWDKDNRSKNYTWIPELRKLLDPIWKESKDMKEFILKSHKRVGIDKKMIQRRLK